MDKRLRRRVASKIAIHSFNALVTLTAAVVMGTQGRLAVAIVVALVALLPVGLAAFYVRALRSGSFEAALDGSQ